MGTGTDRDTGTGTDRNTDTVTDTDAGTDDRNALNAWTAGGGRGGDPSRTGPPAAGHSPLRPAKNQKNEGGRSRLQRFRTTCGREETDTELGWIGVCDARSESLPCPSPMPSRPPRQTAAHGLNMLQCKIDCKRIHRPKTVETHLFQLIVSINDIISFDLTYQ